MAISTYKTFLMYRAIGASTWQRLICIKDFSDLGGEPEQIDVTTLCDGVRVNINGVQEMDSLTFTANYDADKFQSIKNMEGTDYEFAVWFGGTGTGDSLVPTGSDGAFSWRGKLSVWVSGGAVNEAVEMNITISASSEIAFSRNGGDVAGIKLSASSVSISTTGSATLTAVTTPAGKTVTWQSLNASVATVSDGVITPVGAGTTTIIASITDSGETFYDTCTVNVTAG